MKKARTDSYVFTADPMSTSDMSRIETVRDTIRAANKKAVLLAKWHKVTPVLFRVCLKPRLGKGNPAYAKYKDQYIKSFHMADAKTIDVYVQLR